MLTKILPKQKKLRQDFLSGNGRRETLGLFDEKTVSFSGGVSLENIAVDQVRIGGILKEIVGRLDFFSYQCDFMGEIRV